MEPVVAALADQQSELDGLVRDLDESGWARPSRCAGWTIADVVLHLAQTDEAGALAAAGRRAAAGEAGAAPTPFIVRQDVDALAAERVTEERDTPAAVYARWKAAAARECSALLECRPGDRVVWVAGELAARTLATTRLSEAWIHTGDIAYGLGVTLPPTDRLWHIARLASRTLPYAFAQAGRSLSGPVAVILVAPDGGTWTFGETDGAATVVEGPAEDFCLVAGRRLDPAASGLRATGVDAAAVLDLVRTYA